MQGRNHYPTIHQGVSNVPTQIRHEYTGAAVIHRKRNIFYYLKRSQTQRWASALCCLLGHEVWLAIERRHSPSSCIYLSAFYCGLISRYDQNDWKTEIFNIAETNKKYYRIWLSYKIARQNGNLVLLLFIPANRHNTARRDPWNCKIRHTQSRVQSVPDDEKLN